MRNQTQRRPEQRIADDLGMTAADLERIVRHERARMLAPRMVRLCREIDRDGLGANWGELRAILVEIDAPIGGA